jgi:hypothetical protein
MKEIVLCFEYIKINNKTITKSEREMKYQVSKDSRKVRIRRQIDNWRSELSILSHSGLNSDNIKPNINRRSSFTNTN